MLCSSCGTRNPDGLAACGGCGRQLGSGSWTPTYVGPLTAGEDPNLAPAAAAPPDASLAGQTIAGRYVIQSQLGRGGVGVVYRAKDTVLGEDIAIKVLQSQGGKDPREIDRFKREILVARRITHPNVIRIHDFGSMSTGEAFISMELLLGGTLSKRIEQGIMPTSQAVEVAASICDGLAAAHAEGIIHRDIKPDNVLFDSQGRPKVVDFGLARLANSTTRTVGFSGTPFYMSPEQADGAEATARSDVYSLGVMLFELFTGRLPFVAESLVRLVVLHTKEKPPAPRSIRPDLPASIETLLLRMLEKDPARRPGSAAEVAETLRAWKKTPPVRVSEGTAISRPGDDSTVITRSPASSAKDLPSGAREPIRPRATPAPESEPAAKKRGMPWMLLGIGGAGILLSVAALVVLKGPPSATPLPPPSTTPTALVAVPTATAVAIASVPSTPAIVATPTPRPIPSRTPAPTARAATPTPRPTAAVAPASTVKLRVKGDTWVEVSVDGTPLDTSPFDGRTISTGRHTFKFVNAAAKINITMENVLIVNSPKGVEFSVTRSPAGMYTVLRSQ